MKLMRKSPLYGVILAVLLLLTVSSLLACNGEESSVIGGTETSAATDGESNESDCPHEYRIQTTTATCTDRGISDLICDLCGHTKRKMSNPLGHDFVDHICRRCDLSGIFYAADFGAVGDGVTDDGEAVANAIGAAAGVGGKVIFEADKTYYIGTASSGYAGFVAPFSFMGAENVTVDGMGSTFLLAPDLTYLCIFNSSDVTIRNCSFDYTESVYLVGTVKTINGNTVTFETDMEPYTDFYDYTDLTAFSVLAKNGGVQGYPHGFIKTVTQTGSKEVRITYSSGMTYQVGQQVYLPNPGVAFVGNVAGYIGGNNGDITLENVEVRAARHFSFQICDNKGDIYLTNVDLVPNKSNKNRALKMVGWRDGFHCKENRGSIHFRDCENDVVFDDVMNLRSTLGCVTKVSDAVRFTARHVNSDGTPNRDAFKCEAGDVLDFYDQYNDKYYGYATIAEVSSGGNVTLDPEGSTVDLSKIDLKNCRIANRNNCAPGSTIKNCSFRGSFRFTRDLTVEDTDLAVMAIWILVEGGVEGPIPGNIIFRRCTFSYGYMQIDGYNRWDTGKYIPNVGAQIKGICAYDCTFENGFYVQSSKAGCRLEIYQSGVLQK